MSKHNKLQKDINDILSKFFGSETLMLFNNFYKTPNEIMQNAEKMLETLIGKESAKAELAGIYKKYNIKSSLKGESG